MWRATSVGPGQPAAVAVVHPPGGAAALAPGEVHVWRASLDQPPSVRSALERALSRGELSRAKGLREPLHRERFVAGRGILRDLLSRYTGRDAAQLIIGHHGRGKPVLEGESEIRFNVSHSGGLALFAFCRGRELGVDVEHLRPVAGAERMARRLFSRAENEAFRTVAPEQRDEAFLNCWTRKEALVKAVADGLSVPLHSFDVTLLPGEPARLLHGTGRFAPKQWTLRELPAGPSAIAALAVEGGGISVRFQDWLPES